MFIPLSEQRKLNCLIHVTAERKSHFITAVEEDLSFFEKDARQMWIRIRPYELEEIRRAYINNLYQLAGFFFGEESLDAAVLGGIARLDCCDEVRFSFGGYMDQTIQFALFRKGDEHEILSPENRPKV